MPYRYNVVNFQQTTRTTCWEGAARTMWVWKHGRNSNYETVAGEALKRVGRKIFDTTTANFLLVDQFFQALGMTRKEITNATVIQLALLKSPLVLVSMGSVDHAVVVTGVDATGFWVMDPWDAVDKYLPYSGFTGRFAPVLWYWAH